MSKYSYEFKKKIVDEYLNGGGGKSFLAKKYGIPSAEKVMQWVKSYREFGDKGLRRSRKKETYSFDYKLHVVELYLSSEVSYQELALSLEMNNPCSITKWVNDFRIAGPDALRPKKKGRKKTLKNRVKQTVPTENTDTTSVDTSIEHIKELEDELLKLRIENAYLKELRRLRLEEEALLKKQRESSTASEESSN
jgi:transposase-like protein